MAKQPRRIARTTRTESPLGTQVDELLHRASQRAIKSLIDEGNLLSESYANYFGEMAKDDRQEAEHLEPTDPKRAEELRRTAAAWDRARDLFFQMLYPAMEDLQKLVADQLEAELTQAGAIPANVAKIIARDLRTQNSIDVCNNFRP